MDEFIISIFLIYFFIKNVSRYIFLLNYSNKKDCITLDSHGISCEMCQGNTAIIRNAILDSMMAS